VRRYVSSYAAACFHADAAVTPSITPPVDATPATAQRRPSAEPMLHAFILRYAPFTLPPLITFTLPHFSPLLLPLPPFSKQAS
jgi:hypothetical protein